ncbi:MAG: NERD domain-containing protein [Lachnospiraceae bacterium]|nr:NERD domain-containing protein [Lachnospiraceae bacterium]
MNTDRVNKLIREMTSFSKEKYHKSELLEELFKLQAEMVRLTFNDQHASLADLKLYDVEWHLKGLNEECNHVADKELNRFTEESKAVCNLIRAEISGNKGEYKAFSALNYLKMPNTILRNVELRDGEEKTELDIVVITPAGITIVEVKNTGRDIFIDEQGNYFRTGEFLRLDCNIAEKMGTKEMLLKQVLENAGLGGIKIQSILVFTNKRIEVQNRYDRIRTCFVSQLSYQVEGMKGHTVDDMETVAQVISKATCPESYPLDFDINGFKRDFATVLTILEEASMRKEEKKEELDVETKELEEVMQENREKFYRHTFSEGEMPFSKGRKHGIAGYVAAACASFILGMTLGGLVSR